MDKPKPEDLKTSADVSRYLREFFSYRYAKHIDEDELREAVTTIGLSDGFASLVDEQLAKRAGDPTYGPGN